MFGRARGLHGLIKGHEERAGSGHASCKSEGKERNSEERSHDRGIGGAKAVFLNFPKDLPAFAAYRFPPPLSDFVFLFSSFYCVPLRLFSLFFCLFAHAFPQGVKQNSSPNTKQKGRVAETDRESEEKERLSLRFSISKTNELYTSSKHAYKTEDAL